MKFCPICAASGMAGRVLLALLVAYPVEDFTEDKILGFLVGVLVMTGVGALGPGILNFEGAWHEETPRLP
jgi:hypothetical protein